MNADRLIFLLALCFTCVSSNGQNSCEWYSQVCERHRLSALLGSSVLLPCNLRTSNVTQVSWAQTPEEDFVNLTSDGRIKFLDPRDGRVKAFPNQGSEGNFSIRIDGLKSSDLGCYLCKWEQDCLQVDLTAEKGTLSKDMKLLIYICVGAAVFMLLSVGCYFCMKCICDCKKTEHDYMNNPAGATAGASAPPAETGRAPEDEQQRGAYNHNIVYENDDQDPANQQGDHSRNRCPLPEVVPDPETTQPSQSTCGIYPNLNQFNFVRMESQRTKQRFHRELFNRLRQASFSRHYYVNRDEFSQQQATQAENQNRGLGKKKAKDNCEYKNPIYNRSTEQLHQM
uniref:uncharacterized protein isoform X1 n=1 Tax=Semicossyphus pulcher TaxID=241346 RepID=UPI0037E70DB0